MINTPLSHSENENGMTILKAANLAAGKTSSDSEAAIGASPVIEDILRCWNDQLPNDEIRTRTLSNFIQNIVQSKKPYAVEKARAEAALDWLSSTALPLYLEFSGLDDAPSDNPVARLQSLAQAAAKVSNELEAQIENETAIGLCRIIAQEALRQSGADAVWKAACQVPEAQGVLPHLASVLSSLPEVALLRAAIQYEVERSEHDNALEATLMEELRYKVWPVVSLLQLETVNLIYGLLEMHEAEGRVIGATLTQNAAREMIDNVSQASLVGKSLITAWNNDVDDDLKRRSLFGSPIQTLAETLKDRQTEQARYLSLYDWMMRKALPTWLEGANLDQYNGIAFGDMLRSHEPVLALSDAEKFTPILEQLVAAADDTISNALHTYAMGDDALLSEAQEMTQKVLRNSGIHAVQVVLQGRAPAEKAYNIITSCALAQSVSRLGFNQNFAIEGASDDGWSTFVERFEQMLLAQMAKILTEQ